MVTTTQLIHHPYRPPEGFEAPQVPTYQASTVIFPNVAAMRSTEWKNKTGYTYGLHGTPTTFTLEERIASIEGALYCQLAPSGLAAIALVNLSLLKAGDEVLIPSNVYGPNMALARGELERYNITHQVYDPMSLNDLRQKLTPRTRLVWIEAPGSVTMEFPDLIGITKLCAEIGVISALDNTWGAGLAFNAFDLCGQGESKGDRIGVDLTIQALTKYASGGGDVLMGSVCTRSADLDQHIKLTHMRLGLGIGSDDAKTVLRSLPSMALRYKAQDRTARRLARALSKESAVAQVLHPCLETSPGHLHWMECCNNAGEHNDRDTNGQQIPGLAASIFSVIFKPEYTQEQVDQFCDDLQYFKIGYSWGGPVSLVVPYDLKAIRASAHSSVVKGSLVRICVGLEDEADLWADLKSSLQTAFG